MRSFVLTLGTVALLATSSCGSANIYREPIEQLAKGTTDTRVAIQTLANDVNALTIHKSALHAATENQRFGDEEMKGLVPQEFISARVNGLLMIEHFAAQLLRVVKSEEGALASTQVMALATDVDKFSATLVPTGANAYAVPLGGLAKIVINLYDGKQRRGILDRAVETGVPAAKGVLKVLKADFKPGSLTNLGEINTNAFAMLKAEKIEVYDMILKEEEKLSPAQKAEGLRVWVRFDAIQKIIEAQRLLDSASSTQVYLTLDALDESLDALAAAARSSGNKDIQKALAERLATFSGNAVALLDAVNAIKGVSSHK
ncbi:MAG: hypothetical protein ABI134_18830 [Byssovorax sp.]